MSAGAATVKVMLNSNAGSDGGDLVRLFAASRAPDGGMQPSGNLTRVRGGCLTTHVLPGSIGPIAREPCGRTCERLGGGAWCPVVLGRDSGQRGDVERKVDAAKWVARGRWRE